MVPDQVDNHLMADPWMTSPEGDIPPKPFDRRALQATLADAVRIAEATGEVAGEGTAAAAAPAAPAAGLPRSVNPSVAVAGTPATGPSTGAAAAGVGPSTGAGVGPSGGAGVGPAGGAGVGLGRGITPAMGPAAGSVSAPAGLSADSVQPRPTPPRALNPFGRQAPPAETGSLLGGGLISSLRTPPAGSVAAPGTLGGLRATTPENLGPINFSGSASPLADRAVSGLAPTPVDRPTIPLRRPTPKPIDPAGEAAPAPTGPASGPAPAARVPAVTIDPWNPGDDDILPNSGGKRKSFRLSRR